MNTLSELLIPNLTDIINANATGIEEELRTAEDGRLSVSINAKLTLIGTKVSCVINLGYARKFRDEVEAVGDLADPNQIELIPSKKKGSGNE